MLECPDWNPIEELVVRMRRDLVAFEIKDETATTEPRLVGIMLGRVLTPKSWWDHWKQAHPRITRWLRLDSPQDTIHVYDTKHYLNQTIHKNYVTRGTHGS